MKLCLTYYWKEILKNILPEVRSLDAIIKYYKSKKCHLYRANNQKLICIYKIWESPRDNRSLKKATKVTRLFDKNYEKNVRNSNNTRKRSASKKRGMMLINQNLNFSQKVKTNKTKLSS